MIGWFAAVLALVFFVGAKRLASRHGHYHPARRADCPVVRDGTCSDDHDCEAHS